MRHVISNKTHHGLLIPISYKVIFITQYFNPNIFPKYHFTILFIIMLGSTDPKEESPADTHIFSCGYIPRHLEGRLSHYSRYKDPDTISQTSFRSINEGDYGKIQDTQENERLLFQVIIYMMKDRILVLNSIFDIIVSYNICINYRVTVTNQ